VPTQRLYTLTCHQTPPSVSTQVKSAEHNASLLTIISLWFPIGLGVIGLILIGLSVAGGRQGARARAGTSGKSYKVARA
jgi:hypothetical protein